MKTKRQKLGKKGEDLAVDYLKEKGFKIIKCNFTAGQNEIDIIAEDPGDLVFVEVKTVRSPAYGSAEFRIPLKKQRAIIKAAQVFLTYHRPIGKKGVRFDVICVNLDSYPAGIAYYKGAFWQQR
jgi:putative endonuclease